VLEVVDAYEKQRRPNREIPALATTFVVADVETSGLNPFRDRLLSIGAVIVRDGRIDLGHAFESVLRQPAPSDEHNILVHGIDGTTQMGGQDPVEVLAAFLAFAGCAPVVGYHVDFDRIMIERAMRRVLRIRPHNDWIDLAQVLPALFPERARMGRGLDYWAALFGIENPARHNALADAFATAQLLQIALTFGTSGGYPRYADFCRLADAQRWLDLSVSRTP
jgi:DNA polymerase-3 subunit epsilon